jgi:hypothetical protein
MASIAFVILRQDLLTFLSPTLFFPAALPPHKKCYTYGYIKKSFVKMFELVLCLLTDL